MKICIKADILEEFVLIIGFFLFDVTPPPVVQARVRNLMLIWNSLYFLQFFLNAFRSQHRILLPSNPLRMFFAHLRSLPYPKNNPTALSCNPYLGGDRPTHIRLVGEPSKLPFTPEALGGSLLSQGRVGRYVVQCCSEAWIATPIRTEEKGRWVV